MQLYKIEFQTQFLQAVRQALPSDLKILYICLIGSQAKNLASQDSDYDIRIIVVHPFDRYLLQRVEQSIPIATSFQGVKVEGTAVDILKIFDYALDTNVFIIEVLRGISIYQTTNKLVDNLKAVLQEAYLPTVPLYSFQGILHSYLRPNKKGKDMKFVEKVTAKVAAECVYVALELRCLHQGRNILEYATIDQLMEFAGKDEELIRSIIEIRRGNKTEEVVLTDELKGVIQDVIDKTNAQIQSFVKKEKDQIMQRREQLKAQVDRMCLEFISSKEILE